MFNKKDKKEKPEKKFIEADSLVSCQDCKCLLKKEDAKFVTVYDGTILGSAFMYSWATREFEIKKEFYCRVHTRGYNIEFRILSTSLKFKGEIEKV